MNDDHGSPPMDERRELMRIVHDAAHHLPAQAPLAGFVHHNTLHHFEGLDFHAAVQEARRLYSAEAYMPLERFHREIARGRIRMQDIDASLDDVANVDEVLVDGVTRRRLLKVACTQDVSPFDTDALRFAIEEGLLDSSESDLDVEDGMEWVQAQGLSVVQSKAQPLSEVIERLGPLDSVCSKQSSALVLRAMWAQCERLASRQQWVTRRRAREPSELDAALVPFCAAYLDGGLAYWPMPRRHDGFYVAFLELMRHGAPFAAPWRSAVMREAEQERARGWDAWTSVENSLKRLGYRDHEQLIQDELLSLPGWAGMFYRLEGHASDRIQPLEYRLIDYLAVRLLLRRFVEEEPRFETRVVEPASSLFLFAQHAPLSLRQLAALDAVQGRALIDALQVALEGECQAVLQEAYERQHRHELLDAVAYVAKHQREQTKPRADIQVCCCIDDREESLRRHIEELGPQFETFGIAGFYGLKIAYRGLTDAHTRALCPASAVPDHEVHEVPEDEEEGRAWRRRFEVAGRTGFAGHVSSRTMLRGLGLSMAGVLEAIPIAMRVGFPRAAARFRETMQRNILRPPRTRLTALHEHDGLGYTADEAAEVIATTLEDMGMFEFSDLIIVLGHGSTTLNNPHEAAYQCGACAGGNGGPNGRLFADLANRPEVREALAARGIEIPSRSVFVGGVHNTSSDAVDFFDVHRVPETHRKLLQQARAGLDRARARDAQERVRRFRSIRSGLSPRRALHAVEARSQSIAEPRTEYNHCTNAICLVGRRHLSRGLFLDRRAFLVSYDPTRDTDLQVLERLLASVAPVGAGINLEYYFSTVDQDAYGCGTKLPHNVTGLHGVTNGCIGDLRTGLAYQMIDIHEPVRLVTIVEATVEQLETIAARRPQVRDLVMNRWIQLVSMDPHNGTLFEHTRGGWKRYTPNLQSVRSFPSSPQAYATTRENVPPAFIHTGAA